MKTNVNDSSASLDSLLDAWEAYRDAVSAYEAYYNSLPINTGTDEQLSLLWWNKDRLHDLWYHKCEEVCSKESLERAVRMQKSAEKAYDEPHSN